MHKYRRLLKYARPQRSFFVVIFIFTLVASGVAALQPWPMKLLVDHVLDYQPVAPLIKSILGGFGLQPTPTVFLIIGTVGGLVLFALSSALEVGLTWAWTLG